MLLFLDLYASGNFTAYFHAFTLYYAGNEMFPCYLEVTSKIKVKLTTKISLLFMLIRVVHFLLLFSLFFCLNFCIVFPLCALFFLHSRQIINLINYMVIFLIAFLKYVNREIKKIIINE